MSQPSLLPRAASCADLDHSIFLRSERILDRCTFIGLSPDNQIKLDEAGRNHIIARMDTLAAEGLRVLALSAKVEPRSSEEALKTLPRDELEKASASSVSSESTTLPDLSREEPCSSPSRPV